MTLQSYQVKTIHGSKVQQTSLGKPCSLSWEEILKIIWNIRQHEYLLDMQDFIRNSFIKNCLNLTKSKHLHFLKKSNQKNRKENVKLSKKFY